MTANEKHLDFIQQVISRMASNEFLLKGWSVTLVTAVLAAAASTRGPIVAWTATLPTLVFWSLDAYFLFLERCYRNLYDEVRRGLPGIEAYSMKAVPRTGKFKAWLHAARSPSLSAFHGVLLLATIVLAVALMM